MKKDTVVAKTSRLKVFALLSVYALGAIAAGCVVAEPREGYWDREHARYYHNHGWVACGPGEEHCR